MRKIKLSIITLFALIIAGMILIGNKTTHLILVEFMPDTMRRAYCDRVLANNGFLSSESSKARLLGILVKKPEIFPQESAGNLINLILNYPYDPIGIMSLQLILEQNNIDVICKLVKNPTGKDALIAKWNVYKKHASEPKINLLYLSLDECGLFK